MRRLSTIIESLRDDIEEAHLLGECLSVYKGNDRNVDTIISDIRSIEIIIKDIGVELNG